MLSKPTPLGPRRFANTFTLTIVMRIFTNCAEPMTSIDLIKLRESDKKPFSAIIYQSTLFGIAKRASYQAISSTRLSSTMVRSSVVIVAGATGAVNLRMLSFNCRYTGEDLKPLGMRPERPVIVLEGRRPSAFVSFTFLGLNMCLGESIQGNQSIGSRFVYGVSEDRQMPRSNNSWIQGPPPILGTAAHTKKTRDTPYNPIQLAALD